VTEGRYTTAKRLVQLRQELSERQNRVLSDVARIGLVSGQQLRQLHFSDDQASRRLARLDLAMMVEQGVLERLGRRVGGQHSGSDGYCYCLGIAGQRLIDPGRSRYRRPWEPGTVFLAHALSVAQVYVELRSAEHGGSFCLARFDAEPACWRRYSGPGGTRRWLKPDAFTVIETHEFEDRYFIESDCGTEAAVRIEAKARAYISYWQSGREQSDDDIFPLVVFVAPSDRRRTQLVAALDRLGEHRHLFVVVTAQEAADALQSGALIEDARAGGAS